MTEQLKEILDRNERYKNFTYLEEPIPFNVLFKRKRIKEVQVHSSTIYHDSIVGFCGRFKLKDGKIVPLDFDSYNDDMRVIGYEWTDKGMLDILVEGDW